MKKAAKKTTSKPQQPENKSIAPLEKTAKDEQTETDSNRPDSVQDEGQKRSIPLEATNEGSERSTPPQSTTEEGMEGGKIAGLSLPADAFTVSFSADMLPPARARDGESRSQCWERLRREARAAGMTRRGAILYSGQQIELLFPPPEPVIVEELPAEEPDEKDIPTVGTTLGTTAEPATIAVAPAPVQDDQGVSGLSNLPPHWPELPANAQLQVEIAWVTANRLRVRCGTGVDLSKALSPAPSYSALSWLETSILFPAKFADISVKATADNDNEREHIRREKIAIEEIRSILAEMMEAAKNPEAN